MPDDRSATEAPVVSDAITHLYGRKTGEGGGFNQYPIAQFPHAVGFSASDKGKTPYVDASGDYANLAIGADGSINVATSGLPAWLAPGTDGYSLTMVAGAPVWTLNPSAVRLLSVQTGAASTSIDFTTGFDSTYDEYIFVFNGVYPTTSEAAIYCRLSINAGSSFIATGYEAGGLFGNSGAAGATSIGTAQNEIPLTLSTGPDSTLARSASGEARLILGDTKAGLMTSLRYRTASAVAADQLVLAITHAHLTTASRTNAVRFLASSGTINGKILMLGVKNV